MLKKTAWVSSFWFGSVGLMAALVHLLVFEVLRHMVRPEWANLGGFLVAFGVSFVGHRRLTFRDARTSVQQSLLRFLVTAVAGFLANELCFMLLLHQLNWPTWPALLVAMAVAAGQTFAMSRWWAFRR
jgi:putative flippase GtrA